MTLEYADAWLKAADLFSQGLPLRDAPPPLAATPGTEIYRRNKMRVLHYHRSTPALHAQPVVLVPSIINRAYILDLTPGFSVAEHLVTQGFEVFMVDWGVPSDEDRFVEFDDLIDPMLDRAVRAVLRRTGQPRATLVGYCMGGTLAIIYSALHPDRVGGLVNLLGPVDFALAGLLSDWVNRRHFDPDLYIEAHGNMPPVLMQTGFQMMRPLAQLQKAVKNLKPAEKDPVAERFFAALDAWSWDNIPFPGQAYRRYIRALYQDNALVEGSLTVRGERVDLHRIACPVLTLCADKDHIVPPPSATALGALLGAVTHDVVCVRGGHVAAVVGPSGQKQLWPALVHWMASLAPGVEA
ncbi:MAG: alpha/beta fold hydrolase [Pseudomonadota bacterium]